MIKKLLPMFMMLCTSSAVIAEWMSVGLTNNGDIVTYLDLTTMNKSGKKVNVLTLIDLKEARSEDNVDPYLSLIGNVEYNCLKETFSFKTYNAYSKNMGQGDVIKNFNLTNKDNIPAAPGSVSGEQLKVACDNSNWSFVGTTSDGSFSEYLDLSTKKRSGTKVKIWVLRDFKSEQVLNLGEKHLSVLIQDEYDCSKETVSLLHAKFFSGHMRQGVLVRNIEDINGHTDTVTPSSTASAKLKIACLRR
ncbi:MAG: hypothetical protein Q8N35_05780 [Methylococcaceae bacterium]|nr:hypothetical protein [Methylococcaceae bacterium]MDZ4156349.1 hypothetical protein [Methylococcales bacterium]MDP2394610.1 hypothetical protein [Methylococcaceae bacterium]MDP3019078.1 hypothetical protein [Methylococcaceae bacterium]MDP3390294.1 hypothetical protein [Methylococcaceae bacterium]